MSSSVLRLLLLKTPLILSAVLLLSPPPAIAQELAIPVCFAEDFKYFPNEGSTFEIKSTGNGEKFAVIDVKQKLDKSWKALIHSPTNTVALKEGDQVVLTAKVRVVGDSPDEGNLGLYGENAVETTKVFIGNTIYPTAELKTYRRHFICPADLDVGEFRLSLHMGLKAQTLELYELSVEVYPPEVDVENIKLDPLDWPGRASDADWRDAASARIDKFRKQDIKVIVRDADNNPISGAQVSIQQKRHKFPFGTFVSEKLLEDSVEGESYRKTLRENYNLITLPAYLSNWGWLNQEKRKKYFAMADWATANGFQTRGHLLVYPGWAVTPSEWFEIPKTELLEKLNAHIPRATGAFASRGVKDWDVANELRYNEKFMEEIGGIAVAAQWFKTAREVNPEGKLFLSETAILSNRGDTEIEQAAFEKHHKILIDAGAPIDGICLHGHFNTALTSPIRLKEILDRMTRLGDVMVTEFDLDNSDKVSQADYLRDFYTVCFSHPRVLGVNQWGFWESDMWRPRGHLIDKDWNQTVSFKAYRNLVYKTWWTDVTGGSDNEGAFATRAFKGTHIVKVSHAGYTRSQEIDLGEDDFRLDVVMP